MSQLGSEQVDFSVKAKRSCTWQKSVYNIGFGLLWTAITGIAGAAFFGPVIMGKEVHFKSGGVPVTASPENLGPLFMPGAIIGLFTLIGIWLLGYGIYSIFAPGPWFVGTDKRLVIFKKSSTRSIDWEQFNGDIDFKNPTSPNASLTMKMRSGKMVSQKNGPSRYVADEISMASIDDASRIEEIIRKRIRENDPTPAVKS